MTTHEFIKKYHPLTHGGLKQFSWDLFDSIEDTMDDDDFDLDGRKGSISYKISTALEVYDDKLPDKQWLQEMLNDLDKIQ